MVDDFVHYKFSRYKNKIESAVKKIKGEPTFESDIFQNDIMEGQFLFNSISDKIIGGTSSLIEPLRSTYALREIRNAFTDRLCRGGDMTRLGGVSFDL